MFKKIILSVLIGIIVTFYYAQYDAWTQRKIVLTMQQVAQKSLAGTFSGVIQSLSFFSPSIVVSDVEMKSIEADKWVWRCKKCEVTGSWLQLLFKGVLDQHIIVEGFECVSDIHHNQLAVESHFMAMMQQTLAPFNTEVKSVVFKNALLSVNDHEKNIHGVLRFNSSSLKIGSQIKTAMSISDGECIYEEDRYIEKLAMDLSVITSMSDAVDLSIQVAGTCVLPHMGTEGACYVTGAWNSDRGRFAVRNAYNSLMIDPIIVTEREVRLHARFPLAYAMKCVRNSVADQAVNGVVQATRSTRTTGW